MERNGKSLSEMAGIFCVCKGEKLRSELRSFGKNGKVIA